MAHSSRRDGGMAAGDGDYGKQMAASMGMTASATAMQTGGIIGETKRTVASSDCEGHNSMVESYSSLHGGAVVGAASRSSSRVDSVDRTVSSSDFDGVNSMGILERICKDSDEDKLLGPLHEEKQDVMGHCKRGYNGIAHLLLSTGASDDVDSSEGTPLHVSALDMDICTHPTKEILCVTYEKVGASSCLKCMMKLLVKAGADLNSTNPDTPLAMATSKGLNECVDYLLEVSADANIVIKYGIMLDPADATLYSYRIFCHLKIGGARDALVDANACISLRPDWAKGYYRKGAAIMSLKGQESHDDDIHDVKSVEEDAGASTACTEAKLSEDRKDQSKLHGGQGAAGMDYAGASKFYTEMADTRCQRCSEKKVTKSAVRHRKICLSLLVISLLSFVQCGDASDYPSEYCNPLAAQISGLCTAFVSSGDCCPSVISIMDMNPPSICVCSILSSNQMKVFGLTRDTLLEIYYSCQGGKTAMDFTNLCEGMSPTPSISNDTASENQHVDSNQSPQHSWPVYSIIGIICLSILVVFGLSLLYYEYNRHKDKYYQLPEWYHDQNFDGSMPDILNSDGNPHSIDGSSFSDQRRRRSPVASPEQEDNQNDIEDVSVNNGASPDIAENPPEQVVDPANWIVNPDANFDGSMPDILNSDGNPHSIDGSSFSDQRRRRSPVASPEQEDNQNDIEDVSVNNGASPDIAENPPEQVVDPANRIVNPDANFDGSMPDILNSDGNPHSIDGSSFSDQGRRRSPVASPEQEDNQNDIEDVSVNNGASPDIAENPPEQVVDPANRIVNPDAIDPEYSQHSPVSSTASSSAMEAPRPSNILQLPDLITERALIPIGNLDQGFENSHTIRQLASHVGLHDCFGPQPSGEMQHDGMQPECSPHLIQRLREGNSKRIWSSAFDSPFSGSDDLVSSTFRKIQLSSDVSTSRAALPKALEQLDRQDSEPSNQEIVPYEESFALEQLARQGYELPSHHLPSTSPTEPEFDIGSVQSNRRRATARNTRRAAASRVADQLRRSPRLNKTKLRRCPRLNKSNRE